MISLRFTTRIRRIPKVGVASCRIYAGPSKRGTRASPWQPKGNSLRLERPFDARVQETLARRGKHRSFHALTNVTIANGRQSNERIAASSHR